MRHGPCADSDMVDGEWETAAFDVCNMAIAHLARGNAKFSNIYIAHQI